MLLSERLKALADPTRLRILSQLLASDEPICACEIGAGFDLGQPTISHHLKTLREACLVRAQRRGTWIYYRADAEALTEVREALARAVTPERAEYGAGSQVNGEVALGALASTELRGGPG